MEHTSYAYAGPVCLVVDTYVEPGLKAGFHVSFAPPCIDLYFGWWMVSLTSRAHGKECQGFEDEQREIGELLRDA